MQPLAAIGDDVSCYVAVAPGARPDGARRLAARPRPRAGLGLDVVPARARRPSRSRRPRSGSSGSGPPRRRRSAGSSRRATACPTPRRRGPPGARSSAGTAGSRSTATSPRPPRGCSSPRASATSASPRRCPSTAARAGRARCSPQRIRHARATGLRRPRHRDGRAAGRPSLELVPQHPARGLHRGRGDGELAAPGARHANPVTSHCRRRKRAPISTSRVHDEHGQRRPHAAHTPVGPRRDGEQPPQTRRTRPPSTAPGSGRRSPRSGSRRARTRHR